MQNGATDMDRKLFQCWKTVIMQFAVSLLLNTTMDLN